MNEGQNGASSSKILSNFVAAGIFNEPVVIWAGNHNCCVNAQIESDIATMVSDLTSPKFYRVVSVINGNLASEISGGSLYATIVALNSALSSTYGANFVDVRSALVAAYNPSSAVDTANHSVDIPPTSLMAQIGTATLVNPVGTSDSTMQFSNINLINVQPPESFAGSASGGGANIITIGDENIAVLNLVSGNTYNVLRAQGGTVAASHAANSVGQISDWLHLGSNGYAIVEQTIAGSIP